MAVILAIGAIWAARKYNHTTRGKSFDLTLHIYILNSFETNVHTLERNSQSREIATDLELGLLRRGSPTSTTHGDEPGHHALSAHTIGNTDYGNSLHQVIGDALEVFSKHLRAHNQGIGQRCFGLKGVKGAKKVPL